MKRRALLVSGAGAVMAPRWLLAQSARRPRIGYLLLTPVTEPPSRERRAFLEGLREFGHIPGKTVEIVYRSAEGEVEFIDAVPRNPSGKILRRQLIEQERAKAGGGPA